MLIGGFFAFIHSLIVEPWDPVPATNLPTVFICSLFLILVSNCICYNLYGYLLRRFSSTFMSFAGLTTPLFTVLFGWIFFGEVATIGFYASYIVVFIGLLIFYQQELTEGTKRAFLTPETEIATKRSWFAGRTNIKKFLTVLYDA